MQNASNLLYRLAIKVAVISLILTVLSALFYDKLYIGEHVFITPVLFAAFLLLSIFILVTFKSPDNTAKISITGWKKQALSVVILFFTCLIFYHGFYIPLSSRLVLEIPIEQQSRIDSLLLNGETNKRYFVQIDYGTAIRDTKLTLLVSNNNWTEQFETTIRFMTKRALKNTTEIKLPFMFPENGVYRLTIQQEGDLESIREVRIFVRD